LRLRDGRSLYDAFGPGYTLLVTQPATDATRLLQAAADAGVPMVLLDLSAEPHRPAEYRHALLLCRPDQHVVWRGDAVPADAAGLVALLRGARPADAAAAPGLAAALSA
jgi:hypothetical protein